MMKFLGNFSKRKLIILIILLISLTLITAVNANDNSTVFMDENITQVHYFEELSDKINQSEETLVLDCDYEYNNTTNHGIVISKPITIDGAGHTLDAKKSSRIFNITSDDVVLKNINFVNGNALGFYYNYYGGGAIYWNGDNGSLINCTFIANSATGLEVDPYADENILHHGDDGTSWIEYNPRPTGASTNQGGAITWMGDDGKITDCTFKNNHVAYPDDGGAILWAGNNGRISNSRFISNSAFRGSAVYWRGENGTVTTSYFLNDGICDSGIYWTGKNGEVKNSILLKKGSISVISPYASNVKADYNFWGDTLENPNSVSKEGNLQNWILIKLTPDREFVFEGDEFTVNYDLTTLIDTSNHTSKYKYVLNKTGSQKFVADKTGLVNAYFEANKIQFDISSHNLTDDFMALAQKIRETPEGGILVLDRDYNYINGSNKGILISKPITIDGNGHTLNGSRLSRMFNITSDNVTIKNINFINGNAYGRYFSNDAGGGAIYWTGANGFIEGCNFTNNHGSGIEDDPFDKEETYVDENGMVWTTIRMRPMGAKINEGGAIVWRGANGTVYRCIFKNNSVGYPDYGGAICWRGDSGNVIESEFYNNGAWAGAAICWIGDNGTILYSKFINSGDIFSRDLIWFGENGLIKYSFLIAHEGGNPLYPYSGSVNADYNFWGDILPGTKIDKINNLNNWIVLNATCNKDFVKKGELITVECNTLLFDKNGGLSEFSSLNIPGNITVTAERDGLVHLTYQDGKLDVMIIPGTKIVSDDLTKYYKQSKQFKVRVYGVDGKPAIGKYVKFTIGKNSYDVKTDENGYATLKINEMPGKYTVTVTYENVKVKNKITVKTTLITKDLKKKINKSAKFKVKVLNSKGKAYKNRIVKIKFKGKTYKIKTNKKGIATFKVPKKLKTGKYTIKISCNGLTNTNKIIVKK